MYSTLQVAGEMLRKKGLALCIRRILQVMCSPYCLFRVKRMGRAKNVGELVDFIFRRFNGLVHPEQIWPEIVSFLGILDKAKPQSVLEIGTANGGALFLFSRIAHDDARLVSVDLPSEGPFRAYRDWRRRLMRSFGLPSQQVHLVLGDSHDGATLEKVKALFGGKGIDFLFIDGDHSYEGAKRDFEMYSPLVKDGGIIGVHDIATHRPDCGVPRLWNEIKAHYDCVEIVKDRNRGYGLGVIRNPHHRTTAS